MCNCAQCLGQLDPPEALEQEVIYVCAFCEGDIREGDRFINSHDDKICLECLQEMNQEELLDWLDVQILEAQGGNM